MIINIDDSNENADWIKWRRLDIPGSRDFASIEQIMDIPKDGPARLKKTKKHSKNYVWYESLPTSTKERVNLEIRKLSKDGPRNA